ncbi:CheA signal transduction histidine kinase [Fictibacillus macauensis ZFHKF-1]|uniref:Chemotaxis protein CheA n=1 Tax=Fictibacillus macauensis ZFHKF-1 TaxID=1196324 RepID=I8J033_9BACL|nr:chemotaxis protein CheA [Fictibacillus macauensis]EIT85101.1 CheA signal transduction histidine kinase [Fictibacillus macauensis ZFHKF-1]
MENEAYLALFIEESKEHVQRLNNQLLLLEKNPEDLETIKEIFRSAHTLKGMAASMGFEHLTALTHALENILDALLNQALDVSQEVVDGLLTACDVLEDMISSIEEGHENPHDISGIVAMLEEIATAQPQETLRKSVNIQHADSQRGEGETLYDVRVSLSDDCALKAVRAYMIVQALEEDGYIVEANPPLEAMGGRFQEKDLSFLYRTKQKESEIKNRLNSISEIKAMVVHPHSQSDGTPKKGDKTSPTKTIRVSMERLDHLMNLFEELVIDRGRLEKIALDVEHVELQETVERMSRISSDLQDIVLTMRMVPIEQVFNRFPRMIRSLAKDLGKKVQLTIEGESTELDRTVIDELGDSLVHLLRNSMDHGIELPHIRQQQGKKEHGTISLKAYHSGNHVFIEIKDDGGGVRYDHVSKRAVERGIVTQKVADDMTEQEIAQLLFSPGFSTAEVVSDVSGRGVGLDAVKSKIESLGGAVSLVSKQGEGTHFFIQLPLTLSILSALLVVSDEQIYAIPLSSVIETAFIEHQDIRSIHHKRVMDYRGTIIPLLFLTDILSPSSLQKKIAQRSFVVILKKGASLIGVVVDFFIGQKEIVLKSLGHYLSGVFAISGATILGDGQVALVLDANSLMK